MKATRSVIIELSPGRSNDKSAERRHTNFIDLIKENYPNDGHNKIVKCLGNRWN